MTDKILEMAKEAGILDQVATSQGLFYDFSNAELEAFANIIRQDEREQCAKICEDMTRFVAFQSKEHYKVTSVCAQRIRER